LAYNDAARLRRDPEYKRVGLLVVVPLLGAVPERIGILAGLESSAEQGAEAHPIQPFALVVVEPPGAVEHEHWRVEPSPRLRRELGERRVLQALTRLGMRAAPQQDSAQAPAQQRAAEQRLATGFELLLIARIGQRADRPELQSELLDGGFDA